LGDLIQFTTLKEVKSLCQGGEGQYVEFKQNANHPNQIAEEVVGFANSKGGSLLVGVDDKGVALGLKFAEDDAIFLTEYINKNIEPKPPYNYTLISINKSKSVILFNISSGNEKPYGIKKGTGKKVLYRIDDLCIQASRELKNILRSNTYGTGQTIRYTEIEDQILKILKPGIPLNKAQISQNIDFASRKISDCLVRLVSAGILNIIPAVGHDLYEFHDQSWV
jgi:predicted HTH transcriptional regulator